MKISKTMKLTFIASVTSVIVGMIIGEESLIIIGCMGTLILSAQIEILEAIHKLGESK